MTFVEDYATLAAAQAQRQAGRVTAYEARLRHANGGEVHVLITGAPLYVEGQVKGAITAIADMTERRALEAALRAAHQRLTFHVENTALGVIECTADLRIVRWSPAAEMIFGWRAAEAIGQYADRIGIIHPEETTEVAATIREMLEGDADQIVQQFRNCTKAGRVIYCEWHLSVLRNGAGQVESIMALALDVTKRVELACHLAHQATHDPLTGLPNRAQLIDRLTATLAEATQAEEHRALLLLDLDGFKAVNDCLGHLAGDELLVAIGNRLRQRLRPGDLVARLGGDEFAVLLSGTPGVDEVLLVAQRLVSTLAAPFVLSDGEAEIAASVGIALSTLLDDSTSLLRAADSAMYQAKAAGKGQIVLTNAAETAAAPVSA